MPFNKTIVGFPQVLWLTQPLAFDLVKVADLGSPCGTGLMRFFFKAFLLVIWEIKLSVSCIVGKFSTKVVSLLPQVLLIQFNPLAKEWLCRVILGVLIWATVMELWCGWGFTYGDSRARNIQGHTGPNKYKCTSIFCTPTYRSNTQSFWSLYMQRSKNGGPLAISRLQLFNNQSFIGTESCLLIYMLSVADFILQEKTWPLHQTAYDLETENTVWLFI